MSASAPAGIATRNMGRVVATCTSDTMSGSGLRLVISQPEAALYIQLPMLAMTVAVQITANAGCRNGLKGEPTFAEEEERLALISDSRPNCAVAGSRASACPFFGDGNRRSLAACLGPAPDRYPPNSLAVLQKQGLPLGLQIAGFVHGDAQAVRRGDRDQA
jgi:hypothetical protein